MFTMLELQCSLLFLLSIKYFQRLADAFQVDSSRYGSVLNNFLGTHTCQEKNFFFEQFT